jgi:hypothetical protein
VKLELGPAHTHITHQSLSHYLHTTQAEHRAQQPSAEASGGHDEDEDDDDDDMLVCIPVKKRRRQPRGIVYFRKIARETKVTRRSCRPSNTGVFALSEGRVCARDGRMSSTPMLLLLLVPGCSSLHSMSRRSACIAAVAAVAPMPAARAAETRPEGAPSEGSPGLISGAQTYYCARQLVVAADAAREASLLSSDFVLCGEHHNGAADHRLEESLLRAMADAADRDSVPLVLGLEMVGVNP